MFLRKRKRKTTVKIIEQWEKTEQRDAPGILIEVRNGQGILREELVYTKETSHLILTFGELALMQLQGGEYFCPTCEKILKSAYGLEQSKEFREQMDSLNHSGDFAELVKCMMPFWELLADGCYILLDTKLYPTDGNGHLFWNIPNSDSCIPGTCPYYYGNFEWGENKPYFTVATQPYGKLNPDRVEHYRNHPQGRVLAYHMDGYMTALIDGHHKAMAAAGLHQMVDALVIIPKNKKVLQKASWYSEDISSLFISDVPDNVKQEMDELAAYYPDVHSVASVELTGEITEQRLDRIIKHQEIIEPEQVIYFLKTLVVLKHRRTIELFDFFLHESEYNLYRYAIVKEIVRLNADGAITDYLIDLMIELEDDYPEIKDLIMDHI